MRRGLSPFNLASLALGFGFLYLPIVILVIYSFNASKLVTVWGGFSLRWYGELWQNQQLLDSAWITLEIATVSSTLAMILGTMAGIVMARMVRIPGRHLFTAMVFSPLVMPEVITGLSLLLLFVSLDVERGFWTVVIAHTTFALCYVTVIVQSRLLTFDRTLEEAAMDLGAPPLRTFRLVTLPLIAPALIGGWLLAFALSLDDLVIASFTTGPAATTLPMRIYSSARLGVSPEINAVCTILVAIVTLGVMIASLLQKRQLSRSRPAS